MKIDLLTDFESSIEIVSEVYFFTGFVTGCIVCTLVVAFALFLSR